MDDVGESLKLSTVMQEQMQKGYEKLQAEACCFIAFTLKWKDLEEHFDSIRKIIEDQFVKVGAREKEIGLKEQEWFSVQKSLEECSEKLRLKEEELSATQNSLQHCRDQFDLKNQQLKETEELLGKSCLEIESEKKVLEFIRNSIQEQDEELKKKVKECDQLQKRRKSLEECPEKLRLKEEELSATQNSLQHCQEQFDLKNQQLKETEELLGKSCLEIESEKKALEFIRNSIQEQDEELKKKVKEYDQLQKRRKSLEECSEKLRLKEEELSATQNSLQHCQEQFDLKNQQLKETEELLGKSCLEIESEKKVLEFIRNSIHEQDEELKKKVKEYDQLQKRTDECCSQLQQKEKYLSECSRQVSLEEEKLLILEEKVKQSAEAVNLKEEQLKSIQEQMRSGNRDIELKERTYLAIKSKIEDFKKIQAKKNSQIQSMELLVRGSNEELRLKEEQLATVKVSLESISEQLKSKEKDLDALNSREKEIELDMVDFGLDKQLAEVELETKQKQLEEKWTKLLEKEDQLQLLQKSLESQTLLQKNNVVLGKVKTEEIIDWDGKYLQGLYIDQVKKHDDLKNKIHAVFRMLQDPASLVLDAMQGFYLPHTGQQNAGSELDITRRSCMLLLDTLKNYRPYISAKVKEEALKLAREWKLEMSKQLEARRDYSEVMGFLKLVETYELRSYFSYDELKFFLDVHANHGHLSRLRKDLAHFNVPGKTPQVIAAPGQRTMQFPHDVHSHNPPKSVVESLAALRFSSDPAKMVLDALRKRIYEKLKKGNEVDMVLGSCLSLFQGLVDIKAQISVEAKEEALKLALEWKENLGISCVYHLEVYAYLKFLIVFELVSPHRDVYIELLNIPSPQRPVLSSVSTAEYVHEVSHFVQMLIEKKHCIEAIRLVCIFNLVDKFPPEQHLQDYLQKIKEKTDGICNGTDIVTLKRYAIVEELAALKATLNCISDFNLPFEHLRRNINEHISELESDKKLGYLLSNSKESTSKIDKKRRTQDSHKAGAPKKSLKETMGGTPPIIRLD